MAYLHGSVKKDDPLSLLRPLLSFIMSKVAVVMIFLTIRYTEAVELLKELLCIRYKSGRRGYWTVRLSTDLDHLGRKEESLQVAEAGVNDSCIRGGDRLALQRRVIRLSKPPRRWRRPSYAESLERKWEEVHIP